jgi:leucyl/phenylalanyl-tRNA--protein transferase
MLALHSTGHAHSIEVWEDGALAGGLYGVKLGRAFFGESMFSRARDASKVALAWLVARLKVGGFTLLDCQFMTAHLESLGAVTVSRSAYVALLSAALGGGGSSSGAAGGGVAGAGVGGVSSAGSAGAERAGSGRAAAAPPDLGALDRLLDSCGAADDPGAAGYVIVQLLGQTS